MKIIKGRVEAVYLGSCEDDLAKQDCAALQAEIDGFVGDRHRGATRRTWPGDKQPEGTVRRNERQWSAVSVEELADIEHAMDLKEPLRAADLGANLCFRGVPDLSRLPRGTVLTFPSGAVLMVEEYNPPCLDMGRKLASTYTTHAGKPLADSDFSQAAKFCRGLVGVIEVAGVIHSGDEVSVGVYRPPAWLARLDS